MEHELVYPKPTVDEILSDLTAFLTTDEHEAMFSTLLDRRRKIALSIQSTIKQKGLSESTLIEIMRSDDEAMNTIISLMGISQEEFYREVSFLRTVDHSFDAEWKMEKIVATIRKDERFAKKIAWFILSGKDDEFIKKNIPKFALEKFDKDKLTLTSDSLIDSLLRAGMKGRYDAVKGSIPQDILKEELDRIGVEYEKGDVTVPNIDRRMDFVIPTIDDPYIMIECGIFVTTARELSEKGLLEMSIRKQVEEHYPKCVLVRLTDGIGWLARGGNALADVIDASHYVITLKQVNKLERIVKAHVPSKYFKKGIDSYG